MNWTDVAKYFPDKTNIHCRTAFKREMVAGRKKGRWSLKEDLKTAVGIAVFGENWSQISHQLFEGEGHRSDCQIRERWFTTLAPHHNLNPKFTEEVKALLLSLHMRHKEGELLHAEWQQIADA